jgi:hypothetical protein
VSGRVTAADARNRVRIDAGYTRSRFTNPFDPLLSQGTPIVPVQESAQNARYLDTAFDLVQNAGKGALQTSITALFRHERVDPLFRSVGGSTQADRAENALEVQTRIGEATFQLVHARMHDNLEDIASLLTSHTQRSALTAAVQTAALVGKASADVPWAPRLGYTFDRVHQAGEGIPINSDFSATHVPDQMSVNQLFTLDVERSKFRAGLPLWAIESGQPAGGTGPRRLDQRHERGDGWHLAAARQPDRRRQFRPGQQCGTADDQSDATVCADR